MKNVLILGSKGTLGSQLVKMFPEGLGWDRSDFDATDFESLKYKIAGKNLQPEAILNCVAYNDVDQAEENQELARELNGEFVGKLAALCRDYGIPLVHFSSNYVFDGEKGEYTEADLPSPLSVYGKSKFLGESLLMESGANFYLIRTSVIIGTPGESETSKKSFVQKMLELSEVQSEIKVVSDEINSITLASDLASAVKYLLNQNMPFGIYHVTNFGEASWYEIAKDMFYFLGKNIKLTPVLSSEIPRKAQRPKKAVLKNTKLYQLQPWPDALREFIVREFKSKKV